MRKQIAGMVLLCMVLAGCGSGNSGVSNMTEQTQNVLDSGTDVETVTGADITEKETVFAQTAVEQESLSLPEHVEETELVEEPDVNAYVRVRDYIPDIVIDLKYATDDNFTGQVIYDFKEAYLHYGTVLKLKNVQEQLKDLGYGLKIWDAYRPFYAQERLWEVYPNPTYVADPAKGRRGHNLGNTVDITLVYADGTEVPMPTGFDDFSTRADRDYSEIEEDLAANAMLLQETMYANGFTGYKGEWWDFTDTDFYTDTEDFVPEE